MMYYFYHRKAEYLSDISLLDVFLTRKLSTYLDSQKTSLRHLWRILLINNVVGSFSLMMSSKKARPKKRASILPGCTFAMQYRQLVTTCTYAHHRMQVLFRLRQHTSNGDSGWIQNPLQIITDTLE